jgi:hypothetical protein
MNNTRWFIPGAVLAAVLVLPLAIDAQYHSSITFQNGAGETALVKLVGPSAQTVSVPRSESRNVSAVAPGRYYIVVRYGDAEQNYSYMKGDPFDVEESGGAYSEISITLYKVANGNYGSRPARKEDFEKPQA